MSYKSDPRGSRPVRLIAMHTTEGAMTASSLGAYFYRPEIEASSHVGIDDKTTLQYVSYSRSAWTIRSANPISDNAEICGFASWTREMWLGTHRPRLERAAAWARARCLARGIPMRWLTLDQVRAGAAGIIGHVDWTEATGDGTHTDPGRGFPRDVFMQLVTAGGTNGEDDDMATAAEVWGYNREGETKDASQLLKDIHDYVAPPGNWLSQAGWLAGALSNTNTTLPATKKEVEAMQTVVAEIQQTQAAHTDQLNKIATALAKLTGETG